MCLSSPSLAHGFLGRPIATLHTTFTSYPQEIHKNLLYSAIHTTTRFVNHKRAILQEKAAGSFLPAPLLDANIPSTD